MKNINEFNLKLTITFNHKADSHMTLRQNNFQILFLYIVGGGKEKQNRISYSP